MRSLGSTTPPVRLYSGSNRQDKKRDEGLSINHLDDCHVRGLVDFLYTEEYKNKILNHDYLSSFAVFEELAKDNQWECCRYLLPLGSVRGEFADAIEKIGGFDYEYPKVPHEEPLYLAWKTFADKLKRKIDWPSAWSDREWNTTNQSKSTLYEVNEGFLSDHRYADYFFKPMLVFYQMQHFMSSSEQLLAFSLDYDGCGSVIPASNKDMPDHIFLEGFRCDVATGEKLYLAARDRLVGHMQAMAAGVGSKPEVREFHFYDDIYATVVYDFFKDKLELIPEGLQLFTHAYDYYDMTEGDLVAGEPTCEALHPCFEPLIGTGALMPFAQRDQQKKAWQDSVSQVHTQLSNLSVFSVPKPMTSTESIEDVCRQRLDELVVSVVNA